MSGLTQKEIIELRLETLKPVLMTASKHGLTKDEAFDVAERAWKFVTKPIADINAKDNASSASAF